MLAGGSRRQPYSSNVACESRLGHIETERRSATRPRFVDSWQKVIASDCRDGAGPREQFHVDVWTGRIQALLMVHSSFKLLSEQDWKELAGFRNRAARDSAMAGKLLVRFALSRAVSQRVGPREWRFNKEPLTKPTVSADLPNINFSVSHSADLVVVAVSRQLNLGIDIELVDQELEPGTIAGFIHPDEAPVLRMAPPAAKVREFLRLWTKKEAYTKLTGDGHFLDFSSIDSASDSSISRTDGTYRRIHFEHFYLSHNRSLYLASLALARDSEPVSVRVINVLGPREEAGTHQAVPMCAI
jgi:phosphopantetheinyl transferase